MIFLLRRVMRTWRTQNGWLLPLGILGFVFLTSWPLMAWAEPAGAEIARADTYWWYFVITTATVGYGDFSPETLSGRLVGLYVVLGGIATLAAILAKITDTVTTMKGHKMRGLRSHDLSHHLVILGYHPGRTEHIVESLEEGDEDDIVIAGWEDQCAEHPIPEDKRVRFVRGPLTDTSVLQRTAIARARVVLVDGRDDHESLAIATVVSHVTDDVHIVVAVRALDRATRFEYVDPDLHCVQWHSLRMIVEEVADPGLGRVYQELMSPDGVNTYSVQLPTSAARTDFGRLKTAVGSRHGLTVLAIQSGDDLVVSPPWDHEVAPGDRVFYVGERRLTAAEFAHAATG